MKSVLHMYKTKTVYFYCKKKKKFKLVYSEDSVHMYIRHIKIQIEVKSKNQFPNCS